MKILSTIVDRLLSRKLTSLIINILGILLVCLLIIVTESLWSGILNTVWAIIQPFVIGFVIAFILETIISRLHRYIPKRSICITIVYVGTLAFIGTLLLLLIPLIITSVQEMIPALQSGFDEINIFVSTNLGVDISPLLNETLSSLSSIINNSNFVNATLDILMQTAGTIGSIVIAFVLSIYMSARYPSLRRRISLLAMKANKNLPSHIIEVEYSLSNYLEAFVLDALCQGGTAALMYLAIGQENWLILGIITGVMAVFPYVGPALANTLGIIVSISLGGYKIALLLFLIFVQSTLTAYVISPRIYSKQIDLDILSVLFGILTGGTLFGPVGMILAMPTLVICKIVVRIYKRTYRESGSV